jgi:hypothetical protein
MCIVAIVMSLVGSANLAMVTGSQGNSEAHAHGGEYTGA